MNHLLILQGDGDYQLPDSRGPLFVYRIGGGRIASGDATVLNDWRLLNQVAEELRDLYATWVYGYNDIFLRYGLARSDLSLFFLTDFSCKRSEIFDTYNSICNIRVLERKLAGVSIDTASLIGVSASFVSAFQSAFPKTTVVTERLRKQEFVWWRRVASDARYFLNALVVVFVNRFVRGTRDVEKRTYDNLFVSYFPSMFSRAGSELKYDSVVGPNDGYLVSIITDGLHQYVPARAYVAHRRSVSTIRNCHVIDDDLRIVDILRGLYWWVKVARFSWHERRRRHVFDGLDVSGFTRAEWLFACSRVSRLMVLAGALERTLGSLAARRLIYHLHEFPYGRLTSYVAALRCPETERVGFQHGPASWRKLFYFMAPGEASARPLSRAHAPIPDKVFAEDAESAEIYRYAGYAHVAVMERIYRLSYLNSVTVTKQPQYALIAVGLHDGRAMLQELAPLFERDTGVTYLVKPHPRGRNEYLREFRGSRLVVSEKPIQDLLAQVSKVFVTYSSVGHEAKLLGLDVELVHLPGVVNESPLLPRIH